MTRRKLLLIGLDGVRLDLMDATETPNLDRLAARGARRRLEIDREEVTISGPMWTSILTGMSHAEHGIRDHATRYSGPISDVFSRLVRLGACSRPVAAAAWPPLVTPQECGPIIDPGLVVSYAPPHSSRARDEARDLDSAVVYAMTHYLSDPVVDGGFIHLDSVDHVGDYLGLGQPYRDAITEVDNHVGTLMDAVVARGDADDWTVVVTTDHGHADTGGHGGDSLPERTTWLISDDPGFGVAAVRPRDIAGEIERVYRESRDSRSTARQKDLESSGAR